MMIRVRVKASPYYAAKPGAIGEAVGVKFLNTVHEVWTVKIDGEALTFRPDEIEQLDGTAV